MTPLPDWFAALGSSLKRKAPPLGGLWRRITGRRSSRCASTLSVPFAPLPPVALDIEPAARGRASELSIPFARLRAAELQLEPASRELEARFLATGAELQGLSGLSRTFVERVEKLVRLAAGKEGESVLFAGAVEMIERAIQFLVSCQEQTTQILGRLHASKVQIEQLLGAEAELQRTIAPLKFVQTLFKSESAPLGSAVQRMFNALTREMETLHGKVRDIFGTKFKHLEQTHQTIGRVIGKLDAQARSLAQIATTQKAQIEATLETLRRESASNQERDVRLHRLSQQIGREVVQVVMGLQFQDAINQKLQHVAAELPQIEARFAEISAVPEGTAAGEPLRFLRQSSRLLAKQLEVAGADLARAETSIQGAIQNVLTHLTGMDSRCLSLEEFKLLTASFDGMVQVLLETIAEVRELVVATVASATDAFELLRPLGAMASDLTSTVRGLSAHIHLIGLNAQVQAAQAGRDARGAGLEVLAARTSEISAETNRISEQAARQLDELAAGLAASVESFAGLRAEGGIQQEILDKQGRAEEQQLHAFRDAALSTLQEIGTSFTDIRTQADKALQTVHFEAFRQVTIPGLQTPLQTIAETAERWLKDESGATGEANLVEGFQRDYTMASERQVFADMVGAARVDGLPVASPAPATTPAIALFSDSPAGFGEAQIAPAKPTESPKTVAAVAAPAPGSDLGANVELF